MNPSETQSFAYSLLRALQRLLPLLGVALFGLALFIVHREIAAYSWPEIRSALLGIDPPRLGIAVVFTLCGYAALSGYDWLGLEYAGRKLSYRKVWLVSFLSYAISNNVGHAVISGGSLRYRFYSAWGVPVAGIARVIVFCSATYLVGAGTLLLAAYMLVPAGQPVTDQIAPALVAVLVAAAAAALAGWWLLVLWLRRPLTLRGFTLAPPAPALALRQMLVAVLDLLLAALVLYVPLAQHVAMPFGVFLLLFLLAQIAGLLSQVPGGIGVFEGSFLLLAEGHYAAGPVLAALIVYRTVYYFLPLALAGLALFGYEIGLDKVLRLRRARSVFKVVEAGIPEIFSYLLVLAGALLLFSGATPAVTERIHWLRYVLPLPVMEVSHLAGSIAGLALLLLARAVRNRVDAAYFAGCIMLVVGIVASLAKGLDYEEALILTAMLIAFLPAKRHFYRKSALLQLDFSPQWLALVAIILLGSVWLGFFSYQHVEYSNELWWRFSFHGDAARFLRSLFAIGVAVIGLIGYRLFTHTPAALQRPTADELERAAALVRRARDSAAYLALLGDKFLLWSDSGNSFVMFDITRKFWIAMGDPVGAQAEHAELVWKLRELADRYGARLACYQVGTQNLPIYLDLGLALLKLGEEARVPLPGFGLEGKHRANLRHAFNKVQREGAAFSIVGGAELEALLDTLQGISARWLAGKRVREKRFSLGFFSRDYLRRCRVALVRIDGRIVAFANLWELDGKDELSIDLMRYDLDAPNGVMEYLTLSALLWGKAQGYQWFNLGMAPLSGLEHHPLAPLWHKVGNTIFRFGHEFYNFEGLYHYKEKFDPVWQPRYLAAPAGFSTATVLVAITTLIAGGIRGIFSK
jgi:phosphatidylglycerol lysyltransferase